MKTILLIPTIIFWSAISSFGQFYSSCLPEGITFTSQAQIDSFQVDYPGCAEIEGSVEIIGYEISNLDGLSVLTSIGGGLSIISTNLTSLEGLEGLTSIGGDLYVNDCDSLTSLTGLNNLSNIGGALYIGDELQQGWGGLWWGGNSNLSSLAGLEALISIGGDLKITNNYSLASLSGLGNIVPSSITNLTISNNASLSNCDVQCLCDYLADPNGVVEIYNNATGCNNAPEIADACGVPFSCLPYGNYYFLSQAEIDNFSDNYPGCTELEGDVIISGNDITNVNGLIGISSIGGNLEINYNNALINLAGMDSLISIGGDFIVGVIVNYGGVGNGSLSSFTGLEGLATIGGNFKIIGNSALTSLTGLEGLTSIGNDLYINFCDSLTSLTGINSLAYVGGNLKIGELICDPFSGCFGGNDLLPNLSGLETLTIIGCNLQIEGNDTQSSLAGLDNLISIGGSIVINQNGSLTSLEGLELLTSIGGGISISGNHYLYNLTGLENMTSIGGILMIENNYSLASLSGIDNINAGSITYLHVSGNYSLSNCEVESICDYAASPGGSIWIVGNAPGCNSPEEVIAACAVGVDEPAVGSRQSSVVSYPNPTSGTADFRLQISDFGKVSLKIYNAQGQTVAVVLDEEIPAGEHIIRFDASELPAGIYFYRLTTDDRRLTTSGKLVKY
jgi:hypothetical protein